MRIGPIVCGGGVSSRTFLYRVSQIEYDDLGELKLSAASYDAGKKDNPPLYHWLMRTSVYLSPLLVLAFTGLLSIRHDGSSEEAGTGRGAMMRNYALQHGFYIRPGSSVYLDRPVDIHARRITSPSNGETSDGTDLCLGLGGS